MSGNPFDPEARLHLGGCSCGHHTSQREHDEAHQRDLQAEQARAVEDAVMRALFPRDADRRGFLRAVGSGTALAAISALFPLGFAKDVFAESTGPLEKTKLSVGFIPITCATPIIMAHPLGYY